MQVPITSRSSQKLKTIAIMSMRRHISESGLILQLKGKIYLTFSCPRFQSTWLSSLPRIQSLRLSIKLLMKLAAEMPAAKITVCFQRSVQQKRMCNRCPFQIAQAQKELLKRSQSHLQTTKPTRFLSVKSRSNRQTSPPDPNRWRRDAVRLIKKANLE